MLAAQGAAVESEPGVDRFELAGVRVVALVEPTRFREVLINEVRSSAPDVLLVSSEDPSHNLLEAALKAAPERVVALIHTPSFLPFGPHAFFPSPARSQLFRRVRSAVTVSHAIARYARDFGQLEAAVVPFPAYDPPPWPRLGRFDGELITLINACAVKGIDILVGVAEAMPDLFFGVVPSWGTTPSDSRRLAALRNVEMLEPRDDIEQVFARTRILLCPSVWLENFPLVVVEAMLRAVPVIASNVGGLPEAKLNTGFVLPVKPVTGYREELDENLLPLAMLPPQDIAPWCLAIRTLCSDRATYEKESEASRRNAVEYVSGLGIDPWIALFEALTSARAAPGSTDREEPVAATTIGEIEAKRHAAIAALARKRARLRDADK